MTKILVDKSEIENVNLISSKHNALAEDQVRIEINEFAFTSNNITYAAVGDKFNYWKFFPHNDEKGIIPVWGLGSISESNVGELKEGELLYGYFPMASELLIQAGVIKPHSVMDISSHRRELPAIYNNYMRVSANPHFSEDLKEAFMLFQPLFATSFLLKEFLKDNHFFEADNILLTSASSKTAIALAYLLKGTDKTVKVNALTSKSNLSFVQQLDLYDQINSYDDIEQLAMKKVVIVDFAGNRPMMAKLQSKLLYELKFCSIVGLSHWEKSKGEVKYPFKSKLFFAPSYGAIKAKEWGPTTFSKKLNASLFPFIKWTYNWLKIINIRGGNQMIKKYQEMLHNVDPREGVIMSFKS